MKFQKFEISFLIFGSILVVVFNVILVALKVLVVFEIFKETSNKFAVKFLSSRTVGALLYLESTVGRGTSLAGVLQNLANTISHCAALKTESLFQSCSSLW